MIQVSNEGGFIMTDVYSFNIVQKSQPAHYYQIEIVSIEGSPGDTI